MDNWVVVRYVDGDAFALEEFAKVLPVVDFLVELECVVVLVHLDLPLVISGKDFSNEPTVGQVSLGVGDLVSEIQVLQPNV